MLPWDFAIYVVPFSLCAECIQFERSEVFTTEAGEHDGLRQAEPWPWA